MTKAYFVTATSTDVGKTYLSCALLRHWRRQRFSVNALKPVISGFKADNPLTDSHQLLAAMGEEATPQTLAAISPWQFKAPLSPDAAAEREGQVIDFDELLILCQNALTGFTHDRVLIEGIGGAFVPINSRYLVADWIKALEIPAIVVTGSYLGTISHTLATMEALRNRHIPVAAVVISESAQSPMPLAETEAALAHFLKPMPIIALPRRENPHENPGGQDVLAELAVLDLALA